MRKYGVYKLVYSSSCTVYGEPERLPIDEGHDTGRGLTSPYGKSKYFCEEIMKDLCTSDQVNVIIHFSSKKSKHLAVYDLIRIIRKICIFRNKCKMWVKQHA